MRSLTLASIEEIRGNIILKTGLHIGAGDVEMHIGGTDNPVVKHPFTNEPYIPGSSLKGKVRSLLELKSGLMGFTEGKPISPSVLKNNNLKNSVKEFGEKIIKLFGASGADSEESFGPARVSFVDCFFTEGTRDKIQKGEFVATEIKAENSIDRIKSTALSPRFTERVPAGLEFDFVITLKCFVEDKDDKLEEVLFQGLKLLTLDSLGGSGSRGYGRIEFKFVDTKWQDLFNKVQIF